MRKDTCHDLHSSSKSVCNVQSFRYFDISQRIIRVGKCMLDTVFSYNKFYQIDHKKPTRNNM